MTPVLRAFMRENPQIVATPLVHALNKNDERIGNAPAITAGTNLLPLVDEHMKLCNRATFEFLTDKGNNVYRKHTYTIVGHGIKGPTKLLHTFEDLDVSNVAVRQPEAHPAPAQQASQAAPAPAPRVDLHALIPDFFPSSSKLPIDIFEARLAENDALGRFNEFKLGKNWHAKREHTLILTSITANTTRWYLVSKGDEVHKLQMHPRLTTDIRSFRWHPAVADD